MHYYKQITPSLLLMMLVSCGSTTGPETKVFKADGSVQCGDTGTNVDVMAEELLSAGVDVYCSQTGVDGYPRVAKCGAATGNINIYTIDSTRLADAEALGFASIDILAQYQDINCDSAN
jgi:hypothetical protein